MLKLILSKSCLTALMAASVVSVASAQQTEKRQETKPVQTDKDKAEQRAAGLHASESDENVSRMLATCVAISNQHELAMCHFALDHIENPEVKKFTEMLIQEHTECGEKLAPFAPEAASMKFDGSAQAARTTSPADSNIQRTSGTDDTKPQRDAARTTDAKRIEVTNAGGRGAAAPGENAKQNQQHLISIERQVAEECLSLTMKELTEAKEAGNFDQAFLGCQVGAHLGMIAKLSVYEGEVEGDLAEVFSKGKTTTEKHLAQAKKLMTSIGKDK